MTTPAAAQTASGSPPDAPVSAPLTDEPQTDIVVTGSRIVRPGYSAPTPVTALSETDIQQRAPSTLADTLATIPSFRPTNSPTTSGVNSRGGGIVTADLRGLGATRTLVLVDGRRFVPSGPEGIVDLKLIPTLLIDQIEVVTGGASAAYGSDAVAGVVNFRLKDSIKGVVGTVQTGISQEGDNSEFRASLATGGRWLDDRLKATIGGDYIENDGIGNQYTRDWGRKEVGLISNTAFATNGLPQYIIAAGVHPSLLTPGGLIVSGPLRGTQFLPGGATAPFTFGQVFGTSMIGGDNVGQNLSNATQLAAPYEAKILMGNFSYEAVPALTVFGQVNAAWSESSGYSQQPRDFGTLTIQRDNAYLPSSVRNAMIANNLTSIAVGRLNNDSGRVGVESHNRTLRFVGGVRGDLGGSWKYEVYGEYGRNRYRIETGPNNRIVANYLRAIDAVVNPATNTIVCRSTLTNPTNGCLPQNIFGDGSVKVDGYSFGTARFDLETRQRVASGNVTGNLFSTWAGPVSIAAGTEYRKESVTSSSDALSTQVQASGSIGAFGIGNQVPLNGSYDLWEVYGETVVPLLKESMLGKSLDLNGAIRRTDYSTNGVVTTWKGGATYEPVAGIRFRGTRSRDIRAPNLSELFQQGGSSFTNVFDRALNQTVQVREFQRGNTALRPEKADTWTGGVALEPRFLSGSSLSVDYYNIKVNDAIGTISTPLAVQRCNAGLTQFCSAIVYNANGSIAYTVLQQQNLNEFKTSGIDVEARYDFRVGDARLSARALGTYVDKFVTVDSSGSNDRVGQLSQFQRIIGVPHFTGVFDLTWSQADFSANVQTRVIGKGKYSTALVEGTGAANTISDNHVPAYAYVSLSLTQGVQTAMGRMQFFVVVNNLLDKDPPLIPSGAIGFANETSTNPAFYDVIGRSFKVGARLAF